MTEDLTTLFTDAAQRAASFRRAVGSQPVRPDQSLDDVVGALGGDLPRSPTAAKDVLSALATAADTGLMGNVGPRFFGFVIGGASPAATAADMLTSGWDQCAFNAVLAPAAAAAEQAAGTWMKALLGLPQHASVGYVTGAQAANTVGLAIGRHHVLARADWDVERDGLIGAPRVRVVAGAERHATIDRALRLLGLGANRIESVDTTSNGAIDVEDLRAVLTSEPPEPTIVCLQAGNVNTGACDDLARAIPIARQHGAWVHVDGAFGLWAGASPRTRHLVDGVEAADSWATDAHKWLNVPYDCGLVVCAHPEEHAATMAYTAAYLTGSDGASLTLGDLTPESSRRARGFTVWAALRELGVDGCADLVDRCCALARRMATRLEAGGARIRNDVVLNQVLVGFDDTDIDALADAIQRDGTCWLGATTWHGERLLRVSVSNATTTEHDIDISADAILRLAREGMVNPPT